MWLSSRQKLGLIDNYIAIYRVLYNCKILLMPNNKISSEDTMKLLQLCDQTLDLKTKYEKAFEKLKMIDDSFILLKQQLNECKGYPDKDIELCTISEISDSVNIIENDYIRLKL
ncbi:MAG: hypothetical protein ACI4PF_02100 [Christensenellales bacterium]